MTSAKEIAAAEAEAEALVKKYKEDMEDLEKGESPPSNNGAAPKTSVRRTQRSKRDRAASKPEAEAADPSREPAAD